MSNILVTGVNGFVGKHLTAELVLNGNTVIGVGTEPAADSSIAARLASYHTCDLTNVADVARIPLDDIQAVISLAGLANVGASFDQPDFYKRVNVEVLTRLCDRLIEDGVAARVIAISTGALYDPHQQMPITEISKTIAGNSPYAESKLLMEEAAVNYRQKGLDCVVVRPFNHFGPGQLGGFLIPDLYQKLAEAQQTGTHVRVGNLETKRDYTDVRDVVRAYRLLATVDNLEAERYNVCSGTSRSGKEVFDALCAAMKITDRPLLDVDTSLLRPNDPADIYGSHELLTQATGWQPDISFEQTIRDFVAAGR